MKKKLLVIICLSLILCGCGNSKPATTSDTKKVGNEVKETETKKKEKEEKYVFEDENPITYKPYEREKIELKEKEEVLEVDKHFKIKFYGTKEDYGQDMYTYNAVYFMDDMLIESELFNKDSDRVIYSSNHNTEMYVDRIDNVYIVVSHMQKEVNGYYVSFINTEGEILKEFSDVSLEKSGNIINISIRFGLNEDDLEIQSNFLIKGLDLKMLYEVNEKEDN